MFICVLTFALCSLFRFCFVFSCVQSSDPADKDPWKDKGTGQLSIKCKEGVNKGAKESKPTIIVRNDVCFLAVLLPFLVVALETIGIKCLK